MGYYDKNSGNPKKRHLEKYLFLGLGIAFTLFIFYVLGMMLIYGDGPKKAS